MGKYKLEVEKPGFAGFSEPAVKFFKKDPVNSGF